MRFLVIILLTVPAFAYTFTPKDKELIRQIDVIERTFYEGCMEFCFVPNMNRGDPECFEKIFECQQARCEAAAQLRRMTVTSQLLTDVPWQEHSVVYKNSLFKNSEACFICSCKSHPEEHGVECNGKK